MIIRDLHEQSTRHPDREMKPWDYDENLGIVEALSDLLSSVKTYISSLIEFADKRLAEG